MSDVPTTASVEHAGFTVTTNNTTEAAMKAEIAEHSTSEGEPDLSKAASDLGKKGGEAAAEKRKADAKEAAKAEKLARAEKDAPEEAEPETEKPEDRRKGNPRHDPNARVMQATREAKEAREEARLAREEAARVRAELEATRKGTQPETKPEKRDEPEGKPKPDDFADWTDYLDAREAWNEARREAQQNQREQERARTQHYQGYEQRFLGVMKEAHKADPEFTSKLSPEVGELWPTFKLIQFAKEGKIAPNDPRFHDAGTWIADEIVDNAEHAPALLLHLSEHRDEFQRLAALSTPRAVTREIGKILTRLEAAPTEATSSKPTISKATPPVRPVTGTPPVVDDGGYREGMSLDEYSKRWKPARSSR